jgi:hypothetical protein
LPTSFPLFHPLLTKTSIKQKATCRPADRIHKGCLKTRQPSVRLSHCWISHKPLVLIIKICETFGNMSFPCEGRYESKQPIKLHIRQTSVLSTHIFEPIESAPK